MLLLGYCSGYCSDVKKAKPREKKQIQAKPEVFKAEAEELNAKPTKVKAEPKEFNATMSFKARGPGAPQHAPNAR